MIKDYKEFYRYIKKFLYDDAASYGLTQNDIDLYLNPDTDPTIEGLYKHLCAQALAYGLLKNTIKFDKYFQAYSNLLFGFDPKEVAKKYNVDSLYKAICGICGQPVKPVHNNPLPYTYAQTLIQGAKYITQYDNYTQFVSDHIIKDYNSDFSVATRLHNNIRGVASAIARDWLKETDHHAWDLAKPDTHIMTFLMGIGTISSMDPEEAVKAMYDTKENIEATGEKTSLFELDKILFLSCNEDTGYYAINGRPKIPVKPGRRDKLINELRQNGIVI